MLQEEHQSRRGRWRKIAGAFLTVDDWETLLAKKQFFFSVFRCLEHSRFDPGLLLGFWNSHVSELNHSVTWKRCVWAKQNPWGPRWWKGGALKREVANLHLLNFIIASGRATAAIGPCSAEARLSDNTLTPSGPFCRQQLRPQALALRAAHPSLSRDGLGADSVVLEGCSTECPTEGRRFMT